MAVYTHLERAEIEAVLARYGYGAPDVVRAVAEGTVNSSFALECGGERLFSGSRGGDSAVEVRPHLACVEVDEWLALSHACAR